jgi:histidinol-phosphate aminotransferase
MDLHNKTSKAAKVGEIYNLDHFRLAWKNPGHSRLMGNESVYPPSPKVIQAIIDLLAHANYYAEDSLTNQELREKLAGYVGLPGYADWVTLGNGSMEIIDMVYRAFIDDGDEILLPTPDYSPYARRAALYGGKVVDVLPGEDFSYTTESFTRLITPRTKLILASSPNNPTGFMLSRQTVEDLCATGLIVAIDEAYVEFGEYTFDELVIDNPNLIISHTFSKAMGLAGIRLGFTLAGPELTGYLNRVRTPLNTSLVAYAAAMAAIDDIGYIRENIRNIIRDRQFLNDEIEKIPGFKPVPSQGNFVMINCAGSGIAASDFAKHLFHAGYIVRDFVNGRGLPGNQYFRVTIGTRQDVEGVLAAIHQLVQARTAILAASSVA